MDNNTPTTQDKSNDQEFPWHVKTWLQYIAAREQNHLPHAILLSGEEGIGKLSLARRMAKSLLCINTMTVASDACNHCQSCKTFESVANPDYTQIGLLEDKKQIGVDQIRALSEFLNYSRSYNTYRVVIINPVERMNLNAANSLLKSLEEPTANTVIILVTAKASNLLATIKSRCQLFNITSPSKEESIHWLQNNQALKNTNNLDPQVLFEMVGTRPLNASVVTQEDIDSKQTFFTDLDSVIKLETPITVMAKKWEKYDFGVLLDWQLLLLQSAIKNNIKENKLLEDNKKSLSSFALKFNTNQQWFIYQSLIKQKQYIHTSVNPLMFMENMIMLWTRTG